MSWLGNRIKVNGLRFYLYIRSIRDDVFRNKVEMLEKCEVIDYINCKLFI